MYHVIIDTSVLRQDPQRRSAASRRLQQLVDEGHASIHIPEIARREFLTGITTEYRKHFNAAEQALGNVRSDYLDQITPNLRASLRDARKRMGETWQAEFAEWCRRSNVIVHDTPEDSLRAVLDNYFDGRPPFRSSKNRADFPDALIWETVRAISAKLGDVHFIAQDEAFAKAAAGTSLVHRYASVDTFLLETYTSLATRTDERLMEMFIANVTSVEREAITAAGNKLVGSWVYSPKFPDGTAYVADAGGYELSLCSSEAENLGGGYFRFPFRGKADVSIEYEITFSDWEGDPTERFDDVDDVREVVLEAAVAFEGMLDVHATLIEHGGAYISNEQLRRAMHTASYRLAYLDVELLMLT
jgi:hypothetical protein